MNSVFSNLIIILILVIILFFSLKGMVSHFKGEGSCCGGGGGDVKVKPKKLTTVAAVKIMKIEGMHCEHCYARVHNALNSIEGVSTKVHGSKGEAEIKLEKMIDDSVLMKTVNDLGYKAVSVVDK
jgi:copper chaperone CopZ